MKLLFENWRKYLLKESISPAIDEFRQCYEELKKQAEVVRRPTPTQPMIIEAPYVGCTYDGDDILRAKCLKSFKYLGTGSFRSVFAVPDNPDIVLKVINVDNRGNGIVKREPKTAIQSNKEETQFGREPKFIEFSPKVYEVAEDYFWITAQRVIPMANAPDKDRVMLNFFPGFENHWGGFEWFVWTKALNSYVNYIKYGKWVTGHEAKALDIYARGSDVGVAGAIKRRADQERDLMRGRTRPADVPPEDFDPAEEELASKQTFTSLKGLPRRSKTFKAGGLESKAEAEHETPPWMEEQPKKMQEAVKDPNHLIHRLVNFVLEKDLTTWDFRSANVGYVIEGGENRFVVLDPVARMDKN
jgi:hypothetical protein